MLPSFLRLPIVPARTVREYHLQTESVCPFSDRRFQASVPEHFPEVRIRPDIRRHPPEPRRPSLLIYTSCHPYTCQSCPSSLVIQLRCRLLFQIYLQASLKIHHPSNRSDHLQHGYTEGSSTDHAGTEPTGNN